MNASMRFHVDWVGDIAPCVVEPCPYGRARHFHSPEAAVQGRVQLAASGAMYPRNGEGDRS